VAAVRSVLVREQSRPELDAVRIELEDHRLVPDDPASGVEAAGVARGVDVPRGVYGYGVAGLVGVTQLLPQLLGPPGVGDLVTLPALAARLDPGPEHRAPHLDAFRVQL